MSMINAVLWLLCIRLSCLSAKAINYIECESIERFNTFVASQKSCSKYIFCDGENSFEGECLDDNYFDEVKGNCDDRSVVFCRIDGSFNSDNGVITNGGSNGNEDNGSINNSVGNNNSDYGNGNQNGYEENLINGTEVEEQHNENNSTSSSTGANGIQTLPSSPGPVPTLPSDFLQTSLCAQTLGKANLIHLPNPNSCSSYYTCYNGIAIPMVCGRNHYFHVNSGKCELQDHVECLLDRPVSLKCLKGVYDFIPHPRKCEYYYFCSNGFLMIYQCPFKYTWNYERKTCVRQAVSRCFSSNVQQEIMLA